PFKWRVRMAKLYCVECPFPGSGNSLDRRQGSPCCFRRCATRSATRTCQETAAARPLCRFGTVSALFMADPRRLPDVLCGYRATPREIIKLSERDCLAVTPITD